MSDAVVLRNIPVVRGVAFVVDSSVLTIRSYKKHIPWASILFIGIIVSLSLKTVKGILPVDIQSPHRG